VPATERTRSVAILVDDLATWIVTGHQPTGIQRVVSELLDTAAARTDVDSWPAVSLAGPGPDAGVRLVEVDRDSLRWEGPDGGLRLRRRYLQLVRRIVRRAPLPACLRGGARLVYLRLALAFGGIRSSRSTGGRRADLLLVPGGFWNGDSAARIRSLAARGTKVRVIVYDLFPVRNPEWFDPRLCSDFAEALAIVVSVADRIVTLSDEVAKQLTDDYPTLGGKVRTATPALWAHAPRRSTRPDPRPLPVVAGPFILAVGTVEPRKNHRAILDAWRIVREDPRMANASLAVVGRHGWMADDIEAEIARDGGRMNIVRLAQTTDDELEALYDGCHATVHASWAEGFGLPVRESIARGIPTLMSATIPRVGLADGSYLPFDPADARGLASLITDLLLTERVRAPSTPKASDGTGWEPVLAALVDD
jgi:glycosyltransferase involved in cell wall biosynthesis